MYRLRSSPKCKHEKFTVSVHLLQNCMLRWPLSQKRINACAGFVLRKYANESDLVTFNWLDIAKRRKPSVLKLTFKSLNDTNFPEYLRPSIHAVSAYNLRSSVAPLLRIPEESGTFQDTAATFFNSLQSHIRNIKDYGLFCKSIMPLL